MLSKRDVLGGIFGTTALAIAGPAFAKKDVVGKIFFKGVAPKSVKGSAVIVRNGDQLSLQLGSDFVSQNGPDLFIILHEPGVEKGVQKGKFVNLGKLESNRGTSNFNIGMPPTLLAKKYDSVVVWCKEFNVTFGIGKIVMIGE